MVGKKLPCWQQVFRQVARALRGSGLDLLAPLSVNWYNATVPPALHLPYLGRDFAPFAILVGNSKAIWEPFISTLRSQPSLLNSTHPFNSFVNQSLTAALSVSFQVIDSQFYDGTLLNEQSKCIKAVVYWDHDTRPGKLVAMQRLALAAGIAFFDESSNLCVHPSYGPWFALRAVVLFNVDPPTDQERPPLLQSRPRTLPIAYEQAEAKKPVVGEQKTPSSIPGAGEVADQWKLWLAARDAIQPNHPMRYESDQIEYHYTHNKEILRRLASPVLPKSS